jgi:pyruvate dehydrogenase E1 component
LATIVDRARRRSDSEQESIFYYLTVMNEQYAMPLMPEGAREGILRGLYRFRATSRPDLPARAQLFGSGAILPEVVKAQEILEGTYNVGADV